MTARLLALPGIMVALFAGWGCSGSGIMPATTELEPAPEQGTKAEGLTKRRQPTPQELTHAQTAYKDLGGSYSRDYDLDGMPVHRFSAPRPLTADVLAKLPDLPFDYTFILSIDSKTSPGALKTLAHLRNLRSINISANLGNASGANITPRIAELSVIPNLEQLFLRSSDKLLTDELATELVSFPSLRTLAGDGPITDSGLEKLAQQSQLQSLALLGCAEVTDAGLVHLAKMPNLIGLSLYGPKLTAAGLRHFTNEPRLVRLAIGGNDMEEDTLTELGKISTLESLNLNLFHVRGGRFSEQGVALIARLPRLRDLVLPTGRITDAGLKVLGSAPALERLSMFIFEVTDAGVKELARLPTLKSLRLFGAKQLTDDSLSLLATLPELVSLDIDGTQHVTEKGMRAFVAGRADKLVTLVMQDMPVSDEFVAELVTMAPNLQLLNISESKEITDKSVSPLTKLTKLRLLDVRGTSITLEGRNILNKQLPDCRVIGPTTQ